MSFYTLFPAPLPNWSPWCYFKEIFSEDECKKIISLFKQPVDAKVGSGSGASDKSIRSTEVYFFGWSQETAWIYDRINAIIQASNRERYNFQLSGILEDIQLTHYRPGDFYGWHVDNGPVELSKRKLSLSVQLSDPSDYEGGELSFITKDDEVVPKSQGDVIVFPSYMAHKVSPITKGERWALVIWVSGEPYR